MDVAPGRSFVNVWTSAIPPVGSGFWLWSQVSSPGATTPSGGATAPAVSTLFLALRRWCGSVTLAPQGTSPTVYPGLAWGCGLALLLIVALLFQGPRKAIGQLLDIPGQFRLLGSAMARFQRSGRLLAILVGTSVVAWTTTQAIHFRDPVAREDVVQLVKGRQLGELALAHGMLSAVTPLRDLAALGLLFPLLIAATTVLFQYATDRWTITVRLSPWTRTRLSRWSSVGWIGASLYALYRLVSVASGSPELPLSGCIYIEALVIPPLMAVADGVLLAWVVVELRNAGIGDTEEESFDIRGIIALIPAAILACVLVLPSRYLSAAVVLVSSYLPANLTAGQFGQAVRWSLSWGILAAQVLLFPLQGIAGAIAWTRGTPGDALRATGRLLREQGGRLLGAIALSGALSCGLTTLAYLVILALPAQPWVLQAADSYAHYSTLLVGLLLLSGMIDLAERTLPVASPARPAEVAYPEEARAGANGHQGVQAGGEEVILS